MASAQISETTRPAYLWSGSEWIPIGDGGGGGGEIFYQSASPSTPAVGTLWVDEDGSLEDDIAGISHNHDLTYLSLNTASNTYLTINNASSTYATIVDLNNIDLTSTINTASAAAYASASAYTNSASSSLVTYTNSASSSLVTYTNAQVNAGINTASAAAVNYLIDSAPGTLDTLNELSAALNDDPNFYSTIQSVYLTQSNASATYLTQSNASATYSPISNPTFTGTSLFENTQINGILDVQEIREKIVELSIVSGSATANFNDGGLFYIATAPSANFTLNLINVPGVNLRSQTVSVVVTQGATGRIPNIFMLDGVSQTIRWLGGNAPTPTSSVGKIDIFNFTVFRTSSSTLIIANSNLNI